MHTRRDALGTLTVGLVTLSGCLEAVSAGGRNTQIHSLQVKVKDETRSHSIGIVAERDGEIVFWKSVRLGPNAETESDLATDLTPPPGEGEFVLHVRVDEFPVVSSDPLPTGCQDLTVVASFVDPEEDYDVFFATNECATPDASDD